MEHVVDVRSLSHNYGDVQALDNVDLTITPGEIFALIGPNGAGKTTLVRSITGTIAPVDGSIQIFGVDPDTIVKSRIGLLPQAFGPPNRLTGREIIEYYGGLYDNARSTEEVLADIGMVDAADRWYERLSGGQQRRICVGTALVNDPDLLILDEPTTGIDPRGRQRVWNLLRELKQDGRTVLLTTHNMGEAETLADQVGLLSEGSLVTTGSPEALIRDHGGKSRLSVEPIHDVDADTIASLDIDIEQHDNRLYVADIKAQDVGEILAVLHAADISFSRFVWEDPSLEDVYFSLTTEEADT